MHVPWGGFRPDRHGHCRVIKDDRSISGRTSRIGFRDRFHGPRCTGLCHRGESLLSQDRRVIIASRLLLPIGVVGQLQYSERSRLCFSEYANLYLEEQLRLIWWFHPGGRHHIRNQLHRFRSLVATTTHLPSFRLWFCHAPGLHHPGESPVPGSPRR